MRVLYVEHGAQVSGAQRSLLELLRGLPEHVAAEVACPADGPFADAVRAAGLRVLDLHGTEGSFKLHPVHTPRLIVDLARMAWRVRRLARGFDVVHANSIRAGLVCALVRAPRRIVHLRDALPGGPLGRVVRMAISAIADEIVAISRFVAANFGGTRPVVVYNPVDLERFAPDGPAAQVGGGGPLVGVFGQITPWKGQDVAIAAVDPPARLIVVGEAKFVSAATRFDNRSFERALRDAAAARPVTFLGEREDVPELMRACSLVLVPSWEEPFGRVVVEAMACGTPVVATAHGGPAEIITDGIDGRLLEPRDAERWRLVVRELLDDPSQRAALAAEGVRSAARFGREEHVRRILEVYDAPGTQTFTRKHPPSG